MLCGLDRTRPVCPFYHMKKYACNGQVCRNWNLSNSKSKGLWAGMSTTHKVLFKTCVTQIYITGSQCDMGDMGYYPVSTVGSPCVGSRTDLMTRCLSDCTEQLQCKLSLLRPLTVGWTPGAQQSSSQAQNQRPRPKHKPKLSQMVSNNLKRKRLLVAGVRVSSQYCNLH